MTIRLSQLAQHDLDDIRRYTLETWGRNQWLTYYRGLVRTFESIAADPDGGRDRSLFAAGLRSVNYRRHVVFFARIAAAGGEPVILRIVHQRRNMPALTYYEDVGD
ncbi:MAG: type II toxin-antitoxin system RelE/ParE family toxin [Rhodospirillaceae bacterium]|nr:type II toxin-antitoxin system RelE/ParE family toxin [Rhodospirillaceae bacterium]MDE0618723.1 type II toxin-antitoxin system RelE/ParE family toxin [Rhodospirillaceae bacterium]